MSSSDGQGVETLAREVLRVGDVQSAVIFVRDPGSPELRLAAAAGIEGPALDGLVAAVRNPIHPIVRTLADRDPTFDVLPINPGGPRLRSHLPIPIDGATVGVLAVAHESATDDAQRERLTDLATQIGAVLR